MTTVGSVAINFEGNASKVEAAFAKVSAALTKTRDETSKTADVMRRLGTVKVAPSVGGLSVGLTAMSGAAQRAQSKMDELRATAGRLDDKTGKLQTAIGGVSAAFGVAGGRIGDMVGGVADLAMSFSAGGPLLGGLVVVGVAVASIADSFDIFGTKAEQAAAAAAKEFDALSRRLAELDAELVAMATGTKIQIVKQRLVVEEKGAAARSAVEAFGGGERFARFQQYAADGVAMSLKDSEGFAAAQAALVEFAGANAELAKMVRNEQLAKHLADEAESAKEFAAANRAATKAIERIAQPDYFAEEIARQTDAQNSAMYGADDVVISREEEAASLSALGLRLTEFGEVVAMTSDQFHNLGETVTFIDDSFDQQIEASRRRLREGIAANNRLLETGSRESDPRLRELDLASKQAEAQNALLTNPSGAGIETLGASLGLAAAMPMAGVVAQALEAVGSAVIGVLDSILAGLSAVAERLLSGSTGGQAAAAGAGVVGSAVQAAAPVAVPLVGLGGLFSPTTYAAAAAVFASAILMASTYTVRFARFAEVASVGLDRLLGPLNHIWAELFPLSGMFVKFADAITPVLSAMIQFIPIEDIGKALFNAFGMTAQAVLGLSTAFINAGLLVLEVQRFLAAPLGIDVEILDATHDRLSRLANATWDAAVALNDFTWEESAELAANTRAIEESNETIREFTRSLTNIPSGYRVPFYDAERPDGPGSPARVIDRIAGATYTINGNMSFTLSDEGAMRAIEREMMKKFGKSRHNPRSTSPSDTG